MRKIYPTHKQVYSKSHIVEQTRFGKSRIKNFFGPRTLERAVNYSRKFAVKGWICEINEVITSIADGFVGRAVRLIEPNPPDGCIDKDLLTGFKFKFVLNKKELDNKNVINPRTTHRSLA